MVGVLLGLALAWSGLAKLRDPDGGSALIKALHDARLVRAALRGLGAVEVVLGAWVAFADPAGWAAAALGVGFVGYLAWARAVAPDSSCGCSAARYTPVTARSFARAGLVVAAGVVAATHDRPWLALAGLVLAVAVADWWVLPLRRARLRWFGHPLAGGDPGTPVAATVELLESSLAWHSTAAVVRSGLLESWDEGGWRFLRYAGVAEGRPVTVVFALDATATIGTTAAPAVRLTIVDDEALAPA